jgi:hypothetical protein
MRTPARSVAVCAFTLAALLPMTAAAQSTVAAKDAMAVIGNWSATLDGPMGAIPLGIAMSDKDGTLAAKIDGGELSVGDINDIAKKGDDIVMNFTAQAQGMDLPSTVTLTPDGDKLKVKFDIMNGAFSMSGTATKK